MRWFAVPVGEKIFGGYPVNALYLTRRSKSQHVACAMRSRAAIRKIPHGRLTFLHLFSGALLAFPVVGLQVLLVAIFVRIRMPSHGVGENKARIDMLHTR